MTDQQKHWAYDEVRRFAAEVSDPEVQRQVELWGNDLVRTLLDEDVEAASEALHKYGSHEANCYYQRGGDYCTCGFDDAKNGNPLKEKVAKQATHRVNSNDTWLCQECLQEVGAHG